MMHKQVYKLKPNKLLKLKETLTNAVIAFEMNGNANEVFRRAMHSSSVGIENKLYKNLAKVTERQLRDLSKAVDEEFSNVKI